MLPLPKHVIEGFLAIRDSVDGSRQIVFLEGCEGEFQVVRIVLRYENSPDYGCHVLAEDHC
jgi:hypothetical protein